MLFPSITYDYYIDEYRTVIAIDGIVVFESVFQDDHLAVPVDSYQIFPHIHASKEEWHPAQQIPRSAAFFVLHPILVARYGEETVMRWYEEHPLWMTYEVFPHETYQGYTLAYGQFILEHDRINLEAVIMDDPYAIAASIDMPRTVRHHQITNPSTLLAMSAIGAWLHNNRYFNSEEYQESAFPAFIHEHNPLILNLTVPSLRSLVNYRGIPLFPEEWYDPPFQPYRPYY